MPAICRGNSVDQDLSHCVIPYRSGCSGDVFVNGTGISRQGDLNTSHVLPPFCIIPHAVAISVGSTLTFINAKGCGRIGDATCTAVSSGSPDTFAG